jgi:translation initiation factor 1 (eIF-1/SUI1)
MSNYKQIDLNKVKTYSIEKRKSKINISSFAKICKKGVSFKKFFNNIPNILVGKDIKELVKLIIRARKKRKPVIFMMGAHVIKCGLSPIIIDLMKRNIITTVLLNGAGSIHDFEIAINGSTSEDVEKNLNNGSFGMAEETGRIINNAIKEGVNEGCGIGESIGRKILDLKAPFLRYSILAEGYRLKIPVLVSIAIGTDIIHQHPNANGFALGEGSFIDFKIFANEVSKLGNGGVVLNIGSAVILPEVFLKALSIARNLGYKVFNFTTANFDMIQHYRPVVNVLKRPIRMGGRSYAIIGHHEIMIPLLYSAIIEEI